MATPPSTPKPKPVIETGPRERPSYEIPLEEGVEHYTNAGIKAMSRVESDGLMLPDERPKLSDGSYFDGRLPVNWAALSNTEIGSLFEMLTGYADYVGGKVVLAKVLMTNASEKLELTKAKVRKSYAGTAEEKLDATYSDARYVEANAEWLEAKEYYEILNGILDASNRDIRLLSRHIEVKKMEFGGAHRAGSVTGQRRDRFGR